MFGRDLKAFFVVKIEGGSGSHNYCCFWKVPLRTDLCDRGGLNSSPTLAKFRILNSLLHNNH